MLPLLLLLQLLHQWHFQQQVKGLLLGMLHQLQLWCLCLMELLLGMERLQLGMERTQLGTVTVHWVTVTAGLGMATALLVMV